MGTLTGATVPFWVSGGFPGRLCWITGCDTTAVGYAVGNVHDDKFGITWWAGTVNCELKFVGGILDGEVSVQ